MKRTAGALTSVLLVAFAQSVLAQSPLQTARAATVTIVVTGPGGQSHGSGFVVSSDGMIVTAAHVIEGATSATVRFQNGEELNVEGVVLIDGAKDFAIVRVAGFDLSTVPLGNADDVSVGQRVIAIGAPADPTLAGTVSDGLISSERMRDGTRMLQISVPVSLGSSGGPVLTEQGEVIGLVVSGIMADDVQNLNFALPINYVRGQLSLAATSPLQALAEVPATTSARVTASAGVTRDCSMPAGELGSLNSRVEQGDATAQAELGFLYFRGNCVPQDDVEWVRLSRLAADQGSARGQNNLGAAYSMGWGVPEDDVEAVRLYRLATEQGFASAQNNLGFMYTMGRGVPRDFVEAVRLYRLAAEQGFAFAQLLLGTSYFYGDGVPQNYAETVRLYRLAAEQGLPNAQYGLGEAYANGRGVPEDDVEAVRLYRLAAEQGFAFAQNNLGEAYANGRGVPEDHVFAYMWFNLSEAQGYEHGARDSKDILEQQMTREQITEAQRLSREWIAAHPYESYIPPGTIGQ